MGLQIPAPDRASLNFLREPEQESLREQLVKSLPAGGRGGI